MAKKKTRNASRPKGQGFKPGTGSSKSDASKEFNPDYSDVIEDLKRIGILAGSFVVILVALSFILN